MPQTSLFFSLCIVAATSLLTSCGPGGSGQDYLAAGLTEKTLRLNGSEDIRTLQRWPENTEKPAEALVVFIHGTPGSADAWIDTMSQAPAHIAVAAYDRLGFGESKPNDPVISLARHAQTVTALAQNLRAQANMPIILVGHSYGGPVAAKAGALFPEEFHAIVLAAAALDPDLEKVHWAQRLATYQPVKFLIGSTLRSANAELIGLEQELIDLKDQIKDTETATYVIHGSQDDLVPAANVDFMKAQYDGAVLCAVEMIEGLNHFLPWNEIDRLWQLILRSLKAPGSAC